MHTSPPLATGHNGAQRPSLRQRATTMGLTVGLWAALGTLAGLSGPAWALYKVVGPDGRVTYTDRPPANQTARAIKANGSVDATDALPFELKPVVGRFPVTLFTSTGCTPCDAARQLLKSRGVPFTEKTVNTPEDVRLFRSQEATDQLPTVRIGQKQLSGLQHADWQAYLDAAGYPTRSVLPPTYQAPAPAPLAPVEAKPTPSNGAADAGSAPAVQPPAGSAPAGIRF